MTKKVVFSKKPHNPIIIAGCIAIIVGYVAYYFFMNLSAIEGWIALSLLATIPLVFMASNRDEVVVSRSENRLTVTRHDATIGMIDDVSDIISIDYIEPTTRFSIPKISVVTESDTYQWDLTWHHSFDADQSSVSDIQKLVSI